MPQFHPLPDRPALGSFHVLIGPDGRSCVGEFSDEGWRIYTAAGVPMTSAVARHQGYELHRSINEGRRVLFDGNVSQQ